ncbi:amidohydrolase family protein [Nonomuraea sp. NPDC049152]|uniref:amidohydrolase family protein n=1 Tax=Nonomuraea sp. NPDC049152 TaxID=3154350 RepID=UPI0033FA65BD
MDGTPAWTPGERLSLEHALGAYTSGVTYQAFGEHDRGTLEAGKAADLVWLSARPPSPAIPTPPSCLQEARPERAMRAFELGLDAIIHGLDERLRRLC